MTKLNVKGIRALTTADELKELEAVLGPVTSAKAIAASNRALPVGVVKLKRTYDMQFGDLTLKFWRVVAPVTHPNYLSDLSIQGLTDWGII